MNLANEFFESQRSCGDEQADILIRTWAADGKLPQVYEALAMPAEKRKRVKNEVTRFLSETRKHPDWYDARQIALGQNVFKRYALDVMMLLGAMSLPYCYAASPGNKALYLAGKMRQQIAKRLTDTASFVMAVLTPGSFEAKGEALYHIQKTRLIHALVRHHLTKAPWDAAWGLPINQEDMAGTNLAFSYVILLGLQQSGISLTQKEKEAFLAVWRLTGHHLRVDEQLLPTSWEEARALEQVIHRRHFKKSDEGLALTRELVQYYQRTFPPMAAYLIDSQMRYFLGPEISGYLGLEPEPLKDRVRIYVSAIREAMNVLMVNPNGYAKLMALAQEPKG
ncbi:MAG: DUF2236 domain-containing protein [Cyclobacteriaceae bacterium]|jgi:hypothetical protein|nr:DUF2236 domain-containing protein [Cyclobacteriaceae bacterium]